MPFLPIMARLFQSTHPRGVRLFWSIIVFELIAGFNPRTRVGCDESVFGLNVELSQFQSTHPRGVRLGICLRLNQRIEFQSTHPHGVRQVVFSSGNLSTSVSIHAPAWGATNAVANFASGLDVSIHAPAWGATCSLGHTARNGRFNPRTRVGCDLLPSGWDSGFIQFQSTHPRGVRRPIRC